MSHHYKEKICVYILIIPFIEADRIETMLSLGQTMQSGQAYSLSLMSYMSFKRRWFTYDLRIRLCDRQEDCSKEWLKINGAAVLAWCLSGIMRVRNHRTTLLGQDC